METNNPWVKHFTDMAQGLIPYRRKMYTVTSQVGSGDVKIVTPTQAVVDRAKMDVKRKIKEASVYKPKRLKLSPQSGSGTKKKNNNNNNNKKTKNHSRKKGNTKSKQQKKKKKKSSTSSKKSKSSKSKSKKK